MTASVSNLKHIAEILPVNNTFWRSNRLVAGQGGGSSTHSYHQTDFARTIPNGESLPKELVGKKLIDSYPTMSNIPKVTKADEYAQAYLRAKEHKERVEAYQQSLKIPNFDAQPWNHPQVPQIIVAAKSTVPPTVAPNHTSMHSGNRPTRNLPPIVTHPTSVGDHVVGVPSTSHLCQPGVAVHIAKTEAKSANAFLPQVRARVTTSQHSVPMDAIASDVQMSIRGTLHVPTIDAQAHHITGQPLQRQTQVVTNAVNNLTGRIHSTARRPQRLETIVEHLPTYQRPPPAYDMPPNYSFTGSSGTPSVATRRGAAPRVPRVATSALGHGSRTSHLPGGVVVSRPSTPLTEQLPIPSPNARRADVGWHMQGLDNPPSRAQKRKRAQNDMPVGNKWHKKRG